MGTATLQYFPFAASRRPIHCSALTAADTRKLLRAWNYFPHGPKRFARHFVRRRGIPRTSRCKKEYSCPSIGTVYEASSCPTRCRYWVTVLCLPACKSSISRLFINQQQHRMSPAGNSDGSPAYETKSSIATRLLQSRGHLRPNNKPNEQTNIHPWRAQVLKCYVAAARQRHAPAQ